MAESRFSRTELLLGQDSIRKLSEKRVAVFGIGGVGGYVTEALARSGVGALDLIDKDTVSISNINRQIIALTSTVGKYKTEVMKERILDINPDLQVKTYNMFYLPETADQFDFTRYDYVVDAIDTISAKLAIAQYADERGLRLISSMGAANKLRPECFRVADVYDTVNCPLCRIMRKEGRKRGIRSLRVLYSCEQPVDVPVREGAARRERSNLGTASYVPPIMGQMIAGEVICALAGIGRA